VRSDSALFDVPTRRSCRLRALASGDPLAGKVGEDDAKSTSLPSTHRQDGPESAELRKGEA
jgi:hypothetical protein